MVFELDSWLRIFVVNFFTVINFLRIMRASGFWVVSKACHFCTTERQDFDYIENVVKTKLKHSQSKIRKEQ